MREEIDLYTGRTWIRHDKEERKMGFLAQCIEGLANKMDSSYLDMFSRLEKANMTQGYILKFYEVLHTESWENVLEELNELLVDRENSKTA